MAKLDITQLEQGTTIPDGSLYLVEMGDGSGTKAVTQETLVKETGKPLRSGIWHSYRQKIRKILWTLLTKRHNPGAAGQPWIS